MQVQRFYTLTASCPDRVGLVHRVAGFIAGHGGWILETALHAEPPDEADAVGRYFMRIEIRADSLPFDVAGFRERFRPVAEELGMDWKVSDSALRPRVVIFVSQQEHCLYDLLGRWHSGELAIDIPCVISNHERFRGLVEWHGIPFHHVPVCADAREAAFAEMHRLCETVGADVIVLARYMQILPPQLCAAWAGRILNIHHSFLPSFVGARPYHQAWSRGVKLIGATCHYVTAALDQGPIIEQDVVRIDHSDAADDLVRYGKDVEKSVLARGLRYHLEDRVQVHGNKTIVFR